MTCFSDDNYFAGEGGVRGSRGVGDKLSVLIKWFCEILHILGMSQTSRFDDHI